MSTATLDAYTSAGVQCGKTVVEYPFKANGDTTAKIVKRNFKRDAAAIATRLALNTADVDYPTCYLVEETDKQPNGTGLEAFSRFYASVPGNQTTYSSQTITKPSPSTVGTAEVGGRDYTAHTATLDSATVTGLPYIHASATFLDGNVYSRKAGSISLTNPSGGTFTITYKGNTTAAIAYNAADATVAAAFNGLASVIADGITVTAANALSTNAFCRLSIASGAFTARSTFNCAGLTPAAATTGFVWANGPTFYQDLDIGARVAITSHGFNGASPLVLSVSQYEYIFPATDYWVSLDANTIAFNPFAVGTGISAYGQLLRTYTPGTTRVGIKQIQSFYLPGVTGGITTGADIPIPTALINDAAFLAAVAASTGGYFAYDSSALTLWNGWPIYTQTATQINMATL